MCGLSKRLMALIAVVLVGVLAVPVQAGQPSSPAGEDHRAPAAASVSATTNTIRRVTPQQETVGLYEKFEAVIDLDADFENPYDPLDIRVDAEFEAPSGAVIKVPAFYYHDFDFVLDGGRQRLTATGEQSWRVRFAPTEIGEWRYRVLSVTSDGSADGNADGNAAESDWATFTTVESDNHGFLRVSPRDNRYLEFDDGMPFLAIGENMSWYGGGRMADYAEWLDALAASGGNYIRVWMPAWGFGIEWSDTGLGNYDRRQDRAFELDMLFEMARERDIYMMLCLINHGQYNSVTNPEWDQNPFNAANGGPLAAPQEFGTHPEALRLWKQRLRYIAARWGYSTNLLAWEWWNEVNWTPMSNLDILVPWVKQSAAYLRQVDPNRHLITHSGSEVSHEELWSLESLDFTQDHRYDLDDWVRQIGSLTPEWIEAYGKPFLLGEFGTAAGAPEFDPDGITLHLGLWTPLMNGAFGTGMIWWWDEYIHPDDMYYQFSAVAAFYEGEDLAAHGFRLTEADLAGTKARVQGLQSDTYALLWIVNRRYTADGFQREYLKNLRDKAEDPWAVEFDALEGLELTLLGLEDGDYTVEWWDTRAGEVVTVSEVTVTGGEGVLVVPTFQTDWAIKVIQASNP